MSSAASTILSPGRNCECIAPAGRVAWLIDAEGYYRALAEAIESAQRSVLMVGWDFHSRVRLRRDAGGGSEGEGFAALLDRVVRQRDALEVHILGWDFAMIYALEREFLPLERFARSTHPRIHFRLDDRHPAGASHHQKIVVIDDAIAFSGGLDITVCRWDTREHRPDDPRRNDPGFDAYDPFHDAQMLVDGDAARALGAIARERWRRATGRRLRAASAGDDPWPASVEPDLRDVAVGIARTQPAYADLDEVRDVETLYVDAIRAARESIYVENQYFTSSVVIDALADRLAADDAPEVVVVLPSSLAGWLEEHTMGALMARGVEKLRGADVHDRLRIYVPMLPGDTRLTIHAKLMVVDDRFVRIGSANLSNRSMGFDTECDLAVESTPANDIRAEIASLRDGLIAEHLGVDPSAVAEAIREHGSLLRAVESLNGRERRLEPYEVETDEIDDGVVSTRTIFDPERPVPFEELRSQLVDDAEEPPSKRGPGSFVRVAVAVAVPVGLLALWKLTPLSGSVTPESLSAAAAFLARDPSGFAIGLAVFVAAAVLLVPVTSLIVASALVFGFVEGAALALVGSVLSAAAGWGLGRLLWRDAVRRLAGDRIDRLNERLAESGVLATAFVRVVPVAPFAVVNLVAGASRMRLRDFVLGTAIGMAPGTAALAFFGEQAAEAMRNPSRGSLALALVAVALVVSLAVVSQRVLGPTEKAGGGSG